MDSALTQFILYLLFLAACFLVSHFIPPFLHPDRRREHPFVAVKGGRDLIGEDITRPASASRMA